MLQASQMRDFEGRIIDELLKGSGLSGIGVQFSPESESIEFSGGGYFLYLKSSVLPKNRMVLDSPDISGNLCGIEVGYLAIIENSELMLECFSYSNEVRPCHREGEFKRNAT